MPFYDAGLTRYGQPLPMTIRKSRAAATYFSGLVSFAQNVSCMLDDKLLISSTGSHNGRHSLWQVKHTADRCAAPSRAHSMSRRLRLTCDKDGNQLRAVQQCLALLSLLEYGGN